MKVLKIIGLLFLIWTIYVFLIDPEFALTTMFEPLSSGIILAIFMATYVIINKKFSGKLAIGLTIGAFLVLIYIIFIY